jgi:hypothetical protein
VALVHLSGRPAHDPLDHAGADTVLVQNRRDGPAERMWRGIDVDGGAVDEDANGCAEGGVERLLLVMPEMSASVADSIAVSLGNIRRNSWR